MIINVLYDIKATKTRLFTTKTRSNNLEILYKSDKNSVFFHIKATKTRQKSDIAFFCVAFLKDICHKYTVSMKKTDITLWQDNLLTIARYDMTPLEKNILYMVMSQIKKEDKVGSTYFVSARELMDRTKEEIDFSLFRKATKSLVSRAFETTLPNGDLLQASFVAAARYHKGKGLIEIEISRFVLPFYLELKEKFTTFQLNAALNLNSKYAKRLYEMLSMYKAMPDKSFTINLLELKKMLLVIDKDDKDDYPNFADFAKRVLKPAENEINDNTDIRFTYEVILGTSSGKGRKPVAAIRFHVEPILSGGVPTDEQYTTLNLRLINEFGLNKKQSERVISENDRKDILKKLYEISLVKNTIRNIGGYTAKTFNLV